VKTDAFTVKPFSQVTDMKNINSRVLLSAMCVVSILAGFTKIDAGPVRFNQVVQIVNAKPGKAETGLFSRIRVAGDYGSVFTVAYDDDKTKTDQTRQDGRHHRDQERDHGRRGLRLCRGAPPRIPVLGTAGLSGYPDRIDHHPQRSHSDADADPGNDADTDAADHADADADASAHDADADPAAGRTGTGHDPTVWNRPGFRRTCRSPKIWQEGRQRR